MVSRSYNAFCAKQRTKGSLPGSCCRVAVGGGGFSDGGPSKTGVTKPAAGYQLVTDQTEPESVMSFENDSSTARTTPGNSSQ